MMKKIIAIIFISIGFLSIGFAADYADGCTNSKVQPGNYECQSCAGIMYDTGEKVNGIQFYKQCCPSTSQMYNNETECCSAGSEAVSKDKTLCCDSGNSPYRDKDSGKNKCCISSNLHKYSKGDYKVCCDEGEILDDQGNCILYCKDDKLYDNNKKCCDGERYDFDFTNKYFTQCCDGVIYSELVGPDINPEGVNKNTADFKCCGKGSVPVQLNGEYMCTSCSLLTKDEISKLDPKLQANCTEDDVASCAKEQKYTDLNGVEKCCPGTVVPSQENPGTKACILNNEGTAGMTINSDCLINGQCSYNIYQTLGIRKSDQNPSVGSFVQDIILAVTMFIGTVVALVLVVSGVLYTIASIRGSTTMAEMAKKGIINSVMGMVLVASSYAIVRLIQFLATAGGG